MQVFKPETFLKKALPAGFWNKNLLDKGLKLKQEQLRAIVTATTLSERELNQTALKVIDIYEKKMQDLKKEGVKAYKKQAVNGEKLIKNRIEGLVLYNEVQNLKDEHKGEFYRWLPSASETPDPEHQLLYGKIFKVGEGDKDGNMPGERYGCKCGAEFIEVAKKEPQIEVDKDGRFALKSFEIVEEREKAIRINFKGSLSWLPKKVITKDGYINKTFSQELQSKWEFNKKWSEKEEVLKERKAILGTHNVWRPKNSNKERIYFEDGSFAEREWKFIRDTEGINEIYEKAQEKNDATEWVAKGGKALKKLNDIKKLYKKTRY